MKANVTNTTRPTGGETASVVTRRSVLALAPAVAALAVAGGGLVLAVSDDDPIYVAIQAHDEAERAFGAYLALPAAERDDEEEYRVSDGAWLAAWAMLEVEPATLAGLIAFTRYAAAHAGELFLLYQPDESKVEMPPSGECWEAAAMLYVAKHLQRLTEGWA